MYKLIIVVLLLLCLPKLSYAQQGFLYTNIVPCVAQPSGRPSWEPVQLPSNSRYGGCASFQTPIGQSSPSSWNLYINGRCVPTIGGGCQIFTTQPIGLLCSPTRVGQFDITFVAPGYIPIQQTIECTDEIE